MLVVILLGIIQGLTEFLPVSSSGHLVLVQAWLKPPIDDVLFDLVLHLGTLFPVLYVYRADILAMLRAPLAERGPLAERPSTRLILLLGVSTFATAAIGLPFKHSLEEMFKTGSTLPLEFAFSGVVLFLTRYAASGTTDERTMPWWHAVIIGLAQGLAIIPAVSRSGMTIAAALFLGHNREFAAKFSFLLSIAAILGAFVLEAGDADWSNIPAAPLFAGWLASLISGYIALVLLVRIVKRGDFSRFCWWMFLMAIVSAVVAR